MKTVYLATLSVIILAVGFNQSVAQAQQLMLASNPIIRQHSLSKATLQISADPPTPPDIDAPSGRTGGGRRIKQLP